MNQNETRSLWISVASALFAVFLLYSYTEQKSREVMDKYGKKSRVVVAAKDILEMDTIDESMLEIVEKPDSFMEPGAVVSMDSVIGRVALAPIKRGEQILETKIMNPGPVTGLSLQVTPLKRAISIPIDEVRGVAKLLNPGDRIDIIAALDVGKGPAQRREVKTLMQDVTVLATGTRVWHELPRLFEKAGAQDYIVRNLRGDTNFSTITIEANPEEAQNLVYLLSTSPGSLYLALRNPEDHNRQNAPKTTIESVLGVVSPAIMNQQMRDTASVKPTPPPAPKPAPARKKGSFRNL